VAGVLSGYISMGVVLRLNSVLDRSTRSVPLKKIQLNSFIPGAIQEYQADTDRSPWHVTAGGRFFSHFCL